MNQNPKQRSNAAPARFWAVAEWALVFLLFFLYAGAAAPNVNEAHYLGKAKHYWNPDWCAGDQFLESADAHLVFNWTFGWLTLLLPLPTVAWVGRALTWALLAWAWRRLSFSLAPRRLMAVLSAALMLVLCEHFHMAGEWIVGGVEAKGFAFVLVLLGLEAVVRGRWHIAFPLFGTAAAFHVLVGGWAVVAALVAWLVRPRTPDADSETARPADAARNRMVFLIMGLATGFACSLPGLIPAVRLTLGTNAEVVRQANQIYVFQRLGHHLDPGQFGTWSVARHLLVLAAWIALAICWRLCWRLCFRTTDHFGDPAAAPRRRDEYHSLRRFNGFIGGAVAIALAGTVIYFATLATPDTAAALLRFYWYRLSDVALPMGVALGSTAMIVRMGNTRRTVASWLLVAAILIASASFGQIYYQRQRDIRPAADAQSLPPRRDDPQLQQQIHADWVAVCRWIRDNTEPGDRFITPQMQQTFKWYAGRSEVATRKDIPQDARSMVEWWERLARLYPAYEEEVDGRWVRKTGLAAHRRAQLIELGRRYNAQYVVIDRTRSRRRPQLPLSYPNLLYDNGSYAVYRLPRPTSQ